MPNRVGTSMRRARQKLRKNAGERGKLNVNRFLQSFDAGETVVLKIDSIYQKGMFHPRFYGLTAIVVGRKGRCFEVKVMDQNKQKTLIVHPVHLRKIPVPQ